MLDPKEIVEDYEYYDDEDDNIPPPNEELVKAAENYKKIKNDTKKGVVIEEDEWDNIHGDMTHFK